MLTEKIAQRNPDLEILKAFFLTNEESYTFPSQRFSIYLMLYIAAILSPESFQNMKSFVCNVCIQFLARSG